MGIIKKIDPSENDARQQTEALQTTQAASDVPNRQAGPIKPLDKEAETKAAKTEYLNARKRTKKAIKIGIGVIIALIVIGIVAAIGSSVTPAGQIKVSASSSSLSGEHYEDVKTIFEKDGFTNIELRAEGDLIAGVLHKEGDVDSVSIDGKTSFSKGDAFDKDAKIVIAYHSYPEKTSNTANVAPSANANTTSNSEAKSTYDSTSLRKTLDDYEEFIDSYVEFMQKYNSDPSNISSMAADYAKMLAQYEKLTKEIDAIDADELSADDLAYYNEVLDRCSTKLAQAAA